MEKNNAVYQSIKETVITTGLSEHFLRNLLKQGKLPHIKSGVKVMVNVPKLCSLLEGEEVAKNG